MSAPTITSRSRSALASSYGARRRPFDGASRRRHPCSVTAHCLSISTPAEVFVADRELSLTATEFRLLIKLMKAPGRAFSRSELVECVLSEDRNAHRAHHRRARHESPAKARVRSDESPLVL